jgi:4-hydroxy-2-oxoheptanedioate aldolase
MKTITLLFLLGIATVADAQEDRLNKTIELLESGQTAIGRFAFDMSNGNAIQIARSPADFVIIDLEHTPYDVTLLREFLQQMTDKAQILEKGSLQMNVTPIVRMPSSSVYDTAMLAKQVLNVGAYGLMFPTVNTREEALQAIRSSRFPPSRDDSNPDPVGIRGFEPFQQAMWYWGVKRDEYYARADVWPLDPQGELLIVIQIESVEGVENIDEILSVPGIGAILVGSFDLSASLGIVGQMRHPDLAAAVETVRKACIQRGIPVGSTSGPLQGRIDAGETFLFAGQTNEQLGQALELLGR